MSSPQAMNAALNGLDLAVRSRLCSGPLGDIPQPRKAMVLGFAASQFAASRSAAFGRAWASPGRGDVAVGRRRPPRRMVETTQRAHCGGRLLYRDGMALLAARRKQRVRRVLLARRAAP